MKMSEEKKAKKVNTKKAEEKKVEAKETKKADTKKTEVKETKKVFSFGLTTDKSFPLPP